jgi:predicted NBD/HSP70 family sugar kinase
LSVEISNLRGDRLYGRALMLRRAPSIEALAADVAEVLEETIRASPLEKSGIHSIGMALAAVVDSDRGVVHMLQAYSAEPAPFAEIIARRLGVPVTIDNTVNVMARAEHWFGDDRQVDDFSLFVVGLGLGAAQYAGGMLQTGANGMSTEFQHVKLAIDEGPVCFCGARGCLAVLASGRGVVQRISERRGCSARLGEASDLLPRFAREAQAGDAVAGEAFAYAGRLLGIAVANHINAVLPRRVVVLVLVPEMADLIVAPFYASVQENTIPVFRGRTGIRFKVAPEVRYSHGAAAIVLERLYRGDGEPKLAGPG